MVLSRYTRILAAATIFSMLVLFFSCEKPGSLIINCSECFSSVPVKAKLDIRLDRYRNTTITIYEGFLEDSLVYESLSSEAESLERYVPLNRQYTLTAVYYDRGNTYVVVNAVMPRVLYDELTCEEPCYYVYDNKVDLRLKYKKYGR